MLEFHCVKIEIMLHALYHHTNFIAVKYFEYLGRRMIYAPKIMIWYALKKELLPSNLPTHFVMWVGSELYNVRWWLICLVILVRKMKGESQGHIFFPFFFFFPSAKAE